MGKNRRKTRRSPRGPQFIIETVWLYGKPFTVVVRPGKGATFRLSVPTAKV